jgi:hypothetical protein
VHYGCKPYRLRLTQLDELQLDWLRNVTHSVGLAVGLNDYVIVKRVAVSVFGIPGYAAILLCKALSKRLWPLLWERKLNLNPANSDWKQGCYVVGLRKLVERFCTKRVTTLFFIVLGTKMNVPCCIFPFKVHFPNQRAPRVQLWARGTGRF